MKTARTQGGDVEVCDRFTDSRAINGLLPHRTPERQSGKAKFVDVSRNPFARRRNQSARFRIEQLSAGGAGNRNTVINVAVGLIRRERLEVAENRKPLVKLSQRRASQPFTQTRLAG